MSKQASYEAAVQYDSAPINLLDRNLARIANDFSGSMCGDSFEKGEGRWSRKIAYSFSTKAKCRRFEAAVQKFLGSASFGVSITVAAEGKEKS